MLVWCPKCGTSYDVEKRGSVCPGCGFDRNEYGEENLKKKREKRKASWKFTAFQIVACSVLLIIMAGIAAFNIVQRKTTTEQKESNRKVGVVEAQSYAMNEKLYINNGYVAVTECKVVTDWADTLPENYSMIYVCYETGNSSDSRVASETSVYLQFSTGEYVEPISYDDLAEIIGLEKKDFRAIHRISEALDLGKGNLAFLVPNDLAEANLMIYSMENIGSQGELVTNLAAVYQIPVEWEVQ